MRLEISSEEIVELLEKSDISEEIVQLVRESRLSRRARIVLKHILEHGYITTEDLGKEYGYSHPPRAARDVREVGIPLETFHVESSDGRQVAAYKLGDLTRMREDRLNGRSMFSRGFKERLFEIAGGRCAVCYGKFESRYLQVDHRVPYEILGGIRDPKRDVKDYMLLCASCNRAKSWSCEHCPNWLEEKSPRICSDCYWTSPESYMHIALREVRRLDVLWDENDMRIYEKLKHRAEESKHTIPDYVKKIIMEHLE